MDFKIGDYVTCSLSGVVGTVIKTYKPTASEMQVMVQTNDYRQYHAPLSSWRLLKG